MSLVVPLGVREAAPGPTQNQLFEAGAQSGIVRDLVGVATRFGFKLRERPYDHAELISFLRTGAGVLDCGCERA